MPESPFPRGPDEPPPQEGVNASLLRSNRRIWILCAVVLAFALALMGTELFFGFPDRWHIVVPVLALLLILGGVGLGKWALSQRDVLKYKGWK